MSLASNGFPLCTGRLNYVSSQRQAAHALPVFFPSEDVRASKSRELAERKHKSATCGAAVEQVGEVSLTHCSHLFAKFSPSLHTAIDICLWAGNFCFHNETTLRAPPLPPPHPLSPVCLCNLKGLSYAQCTCSREATGSYPKGHYDWVRMYV